MTVTYRLHDRDTGEYIPMYTRDVDSVDEYEWWVDSYRKLGYSEYKQERGETFVSYTLHAPNDTSMAVQIHLDRTSA